MLVASVVSCTLYVQTMEPPAHQIMLDNPMSQQSMAGYDPAWQSRNDPDSPNAKKQAPCPSIGEEKQEYCPYRSQESEHIVKLCDLELVRRLNKEGDPLIEEYAQRNTITKRYPMSACLAFFAHIKKAEALTIPVGNATTYANGAAESATHAGVGSAAYFFSSKQYFCTASLRHPNGQFMPPRYLDDATFGILYTLFQEQERVIKRQYVKKKLKAVAAVQRKRDSKVTIHSSKQYSQQRSKLL